MSTLWNDLVARNPMTIEIRRAVRKSLTFGGAKGDSAVLLIGIIVYAILVMVVINYRGDFPPIGIFSIQMIVAVLAAPMTLHASIAGERERRTWDLLMVAPVSKAQVVVGKFLGGLAVQAAIAGFLFIPAFIAGVTYTRTNYGSGGLSVLQFFQMEIFCLALGIFSCAVVMLISARVKRSFVSLGVSFFTLFFIFAIFPALLTGAGGGAGPIGELLLAWHPVQVITDMTRAPGSTIYSGGVPVGTYGSGASNYLIGIWQAIVYLVFSGIFVTWAIKTVIFADNEIKFLPKAPTNS